MARYFKYKTLDDLLQDAQDMGESLTAEEDLSPLFEPLEIRGKLLKNRLAVQPMEGCDGTLEGLPDELTYRRYQRFGAGGAGLIWGEATAIADEGRMNPRQLWINEQTVAALTEMLNRCRAAHEEATGSAEGLLIGLQLTHSGRFSYRRPLIATRDPLMDPLTIDKTDGRAIPVDYPLLTDEELKQIGDQYLEAVDLAVECGVDFVDIKQCHRYLLSELLGAKNRPGTYGGSFENRTRLIREIIQGIRQKHPDLIIASRFNAYDGIPYQGVGEEFIGQPVPHERPLVNGFGMNAENHLEEEISEPIELARQMRDWGVDLLNVSAGNPYACPHFVRPAEFPPVDGYHAPEHPLQGVMRHFRLTRLIQQAVPEIPVVGSGYSWFQDYALHAGAGNVKNKYAAIVGMGRATLSHPDFAIAVQQHGKMNRKRICRTFSYCTNLMRTKDHPLGQYPTGCPPFDKDVYDPIWKEAKTKIDAQSQ